jgi:hypothetical protein
MSFTDSLAPSLEALGLQLQRTCSNSFYPVAVLAALGILLILSMNFVRRYLKFVSKGEQLFVEDLTEMRVINGPTICLVPLMHTKAYKKQAKALGPLEYCFIRNKLNGERRVEVGPKLLFLQPYDEEDGPIRIAISLKATQFVRFLDKETGQVRVERGEQGKVIPAPYEEFLDSEGPRDAISLKCYEYVRIEDKKSGTVRVEKGEQLVFLTGHEEIVGKVNKAVEVDAETAVLVRNKRSGQQRLITEKQVSHELPLSIVPTWCI